MKSKWKTSSGNLGGMDRKKFCLGLQWWEGCRGDREVALWLHVKGRSRRSLVTAHLWQPRRGGAELSVDLAPSTYSHQIMMLMKIINT